MSDDDRGRPADAPSPGPVRVEPMDEHNRRLVENVHPSGYRNPEPRPRYHLVVVGAGSGGLVSSAIAAGLGARVALVEEHLLGGDCLNVGCVPSKGLIRAARAWKSAAIAHEEFAGPRVAAGPSSGADFARAMERMRRVRAGISRVDSVQRYRELGVDVFLGRARFTGKDHLEVDGKTLRFRRAVIATGARAAMPPIPGLADAGCLTNETVFTLTALPARLAILGAGPIGCELGQAFARFGSEVTILGRGDRILPREPAAAARIVEDAMRRDGVRLEAGADVQRVERSGDERILHYERRGSRSTIAADAILVATGRAPNVDLGLEAAGVEHDAREGVRVDDRLRTTNPRIFAVGDCCSKLKFTHVADAHARLVVQNALFFGRKRASALVVPWCTYTSPEIAHVGLSEEEAVKSGYEVETVRLALDEVDRAVLDGEAEGLLEVRVDRRSGRILGGTLVAEHAGEMIGELALATTSRLRIGALSSTIHPYPTQAEVFRKAGDAWNRRRLTPFARRLFAGFFKIFR